MSEFGISMTRRVSFANCHNLANENYSEYYDYSLVMTLDFEAEGVYKNMGSIYSLIYYLEGKWSY